MHNSSWNNELSYTIINPCLGKVYTVHFCALDKVLKGHIWTLLLSVTVANIIKHRYQHGLLSHHEYHNTTSRSQSGAGELI